MLGPASTEESTRFVIFLAQRDRGSKHTLHRRLFSSAINNSHLGLTELQNRRHVKNHATLPRKSCCDKFVCLKGLRNPENLFYDV